jgi:glycosyltransferase involved in cell wall biosynthesis
LTAVRILVVTPTAPWPTRSGLQIRIASTVRALAAFGDVDLFTFADGEPVGTRSIPPGAPVGVWRAAPARRRSRGVATRTRLLFGRRPRVVAVRDHAEVRRALTSWAPHYDLVWCCRAESLVAVASALDAPIVVDLDDLEAVKLRSARPLMARDDTRRLAALRSQAMRLDARRWERLQLEAVRRARAAVVASEADRARFGIPQIAVVPNMYPSPTVAMGRVTVAAPPTISFIGLLTYPPNADAMRQLAHEVVPRLHAEDPSIRFRAVGRHDDDLARDCRDVSFVGEVDQVEPELARADVIAVPLRFGSGTRVKLLEAFAHRVPVVSTHAGADGLPVRDGEHLLLADDPDAFARACLRLLRDVDLRQRLASRAHDLWAEHFSEEPFQRCVSQVIERVLPTLAGTDPPIDSLAGPRLPEP